jgi:putative phosphoribosyl transferase
MGSADPSRAWPRSWKLPGRALSPYTDRRDAGRLLATHLRVSREPAPLVLALPRGGIPVAYEVARALGAALDVLVVRKLGAPSQPELGIGAIAESGVLLVDHGSLALLGLAYADVEPVIARERAELAERVARYRQGRPPPDLDGRTVVLVDDGLATGVTARAAVASARRQGAREVVVAAPVGAPESARTLARYADDVVCPMRPASFGAVGEWYVHFEQLPDEDLAELLKRGQETT